MAKVKIRYFHWREGRPRWEPGPGLRKLGFRGKDLKDAKGHWLGKSAAMEAAEELSRMATSPESATAPRPSYRVSNDRTLAHLFALYQASDHFTKRLAPRTRAGYRAHMALLSQWAGDVEVSRITRAAIAEFDGALREERGLTMANAIMRTLKLTLYFAVTDLEWLDRNRAARMKRPQAPGRLVLWTPEEITAFVACADWLGLEGQGDALLLGLLTGQRLGDLLALPPLKLDGGVYRIAMAKTGRTAYVPPTQMLTARLEMAAERRAARWPNVRFAHQLVDSRGQPYVSRPKPSKGENAPKQEDYANASRFGEEFRLVRAVASGAIACLDAIAAFVTNAHVPLPLRGEGLGVGGVYTLRNLPFSFQATMLTKHFADLRDTAVTWLYDATGGDLARVVTITGHSLKTAQTLIDKHYFVRQAARAISAGLALDAQLAKTFGG